MVAGPTGTGKSDLGLDLAERLGGEVVNADSMQLYRGMDIGTAKVPVDQRRGVPHHLLDVLDVTQTASVAAYQRQARAVVEDIRARGKPGHRGRRLRVVRPGHRRRHRFPGHRPTGAGPAAGRTGRAGHRRPLPSLAGGGPGGRGGHRTRQRASDRPSVGGHRDHRTAVHRVAAGPRTGPLRSVAGEAGPGDRGTGRPAGTARPGNGGRRIPRRGPRVGRRGDPARTDRVQGPRLPADAGRTGRHARAGAGHRGHGGRDPALRPAAAQLVPQGFPDGGRGRGASPGRRTGCSTCSVADSDRRRPARRRRPAGPVRARNLEP